MEYPQDNEALAFDAVLKHIGRVENLEHDLPVYFAPGDLVPEHGTLCEHARLLEDFSADNVGEGWMMPVKKSGEPVEIGKRVCRPFDFHLPGQGLNSGVPQVFIQRSTSS